MKQNFFIKFLYLFSFTEAKTFIKKRRNKCPVNTFLHPVPDIIKKMCETGCKNVFPGQLFCSFLQKIQISQMQKTNSPKN